MYAFMHPCMNMHDTRVIIVSSCLHTAPYLLDD